jgi:hypothetical protein
MLMKVYGGTREQEAQSLCGCCNHSRIIRGHRLEEEVVICDAVFQQALRITFKVTSCSSYSDNREPSYRELLEKAWILRPPSKRRPAGFVRATDLTEPEMREVFEDPTDRD